MDDSAGAVATAVSLYVPSVSLVRGSHRINSGQSREASRVMKLQSVALQGLADLLVCVMELQEL